MKKLSIFVPRPDSINPINPRSQKRQQLHSFKAINAVGASRLDGQWGGAVDKIAGLTKKAKAILEKIAKDMPPFTKQDRPGKVKEIYKALKRDHPGWSAGKKARIAESTYNKMND